MCLARLRSIAPDSPPFQGRGFDLFASGSGSTNGPRMGSEVVRGGVFRRSMTGACSTPTGGMRDGPPGTATQKSVGHCDCVPVSPDFGTHGPAGLDANPGSVGHMSCVPSHWSAAARRTAGMRRKLTSAVHPHVSGIDGKPAGQLSTDGGGAHCVVGCQWAGMGTGVPLVSGGAGV
jgi:hypothetical protein